MRKNFFGTTEILILQRNITFDNVAIQEEIRSKRSEKMESDDQLTGDPEERFKKYNRARVLLGKRANF